jgi:CRP-like cAMP-binding protein
MGDFSDEDMAWAYAVGEKRQVRPGEAIIHEGQPVRDLYIVLKGAFVVTSRKRDMSEVHQLGPGEIVGEMSYVSKQLPYSSVRAATESVVFRIPLTALDQKIAADPGFAARFHKVVSQFTVARLLEWGPPRPEPQPSEASGDASLRVHELIERMLRGEFP